MDAYTIIELGLSSIDIIICGAIVAFTVPKINADKEDAVPVALFDFAMISMMLSEIYWVVFPLMRGDVRMPIAANEMGEIACFLLMSSAVRLGYRRETIPARTEIIGAAIFSAAQIVLWILWTGEWVQDIIGGMAFAYMLCVAAWALKQADVMSANMWRALGFSCFAAVALNGIAFLVDEKLENILLAIANFFMLSWLILFAINSIASVKNKASAKIQITFAFTTFVWSISTMYISEGITYEIALTASIFIKLLILITLRNEMEES